jgi:hypothetical protein
MIGTITPTSAGYNLVSYSISIVSFANSMVFSELSKETIKSSSIE